MKKEAETSAVGTEPPLVTLFMRENSAQINGFKGAKIFTGHLVNIAGQAFVRCEYHSESQAVFKGRYKWLLVPVSHGELAEHRPGYAGDRGQEG